MPVEVGVIPQEAHAGSRPRIGVVRVVHCHKLGAWLGVQEKLPAGEGLCKLYVLAVTHIVWIYVRIMGCDDDGNARHACKAKARQERLGGIRALVKRRFRANRVKQKQADENEKQALFGDGDGNGHVELRRVVNIGFARLKDAVGGRRIGGCVFGFGPSARRCWSSGYEQLFHLARWVNDI